MWQLVFIQSQVLRAGRYCRCLLLITVMVSVLMVFGKHMCWGLVPSWWSWWGWQSFNSWGLVEEASGSYPWWGSKALSPPSLSLLLPAAMRWAVLLHQVPPTTVLCLVMGPIQQSQVTSAWKLWNHEPKQTFPSVSWLSQIFCCSLRKQTIENMCWTATHGHVPHEVLCIHSFISWGSCYDHSHFTDEEIEAQWS